MKSNGTGTETRSSFLQRIRVVYRKYDGSLHWNYETELLGEDEHGVWVGAGPATQVYKGSTLKGAPESPHVLLFPRQAWWTACFNAEPHRTEIYCDITSVPHWPTGTEVTAIDLDLDVRRRRNGEVELLDEDEFAVHQVRFGYPADVVTAALASADWLLGAVRGRVEPFGSAYHQWLGLVR
jgi:protein associated with RNAse G/E